MTQRRKFVGLRFKPIDLYRNNPNKKKPVVVIFESGKLCRFPSVREAALIMGVPQSNIVACIKGRVKTAGGYIWRYADGEERKANDAERKAD